MIPFAKENIFRKQFLYESEGAFDVSEVSDMTIRDIANLANVSVSTVSKVLSGKDGSIGQETKERIQKIAKEYNYVPYGNAIAGRPSQLLGILMGRDTAFTLLIAPESARRHSLAGTAPLFVCPTRRPRSSPT